MIEKIDLKDCLDEHGVLGWHNELAEKLNEVIDAVNENMLCLRAAFCTDVTDGDLEEHKPC